ncbi:hypothetical protein U1Q18_043941 [Sarracenia purpurea var. burkii]|jgi:hypothetical protein
MEERPPNLVSSNVGLTPPKEGTQKPGSNPESDLFKKSVKVKSKPKDTSYYLSRGRRIQMLTRESSNSGMLLRKEGRKGWLNSIFNSSLPTLLAFPAPSLRREARYSFS